MGCTKGPQTLYARRSISLFGRESRGNVILSIAISTCLCGLTLSPVPVHAEESHLLRIELYPSDVATVVTPDCVERIRRSNASREGPAIRLTADDFDGMPDANGILWFRSAPIGERIWTGALSTWCFVLRKDALPEQIGTMTVAESARRVKGLWLGVVRQADRYGIRWRVSESSQLDTR